MKNIAIIAIMLLSVVGANAVSKKSCVEPDTIPAELGVKRGIYSISSQIKMCEDVLDECCESRVLDKSGCKYYKTIKKRKDVKLYIELIYECMDEDNFWDTVAEGDAWYYYRTYMLNNLIEN